MSYSRAFVNVPLFTFINEIQGKAFVIHLSFVEEYVLSLL